MSENHTEKAVEKAIEKFDGKELIIRTGSALQLYNPRKILISGAIDAPSRFIKKRKSDYGGKENTVNVVFSKNDGKITLTCGEKEEFNSVIEGVLKINPDLLSFGINNNKKTYTINDLKYFIKMNRVFFDDKEKAMLIVANLEKFRATSTNILEQENDGRGNRKDNLEVKMDSNLDLQFILNMPVFIGQSPKKFNVEIGFDVREKNISVWLESAELKEIEISDRNTIIDAQLSNFDEYVVIEQ